ncbi:MAG: energy transducer TonB [Bacteroidales bacterium]|nr:energy transducer TonB [Bacteroidales bacterium]
MNQEKKNKVTSGIITAIVLGAIVVICLAFGYDPPDPPIPEEGVEVNLGNSDNGSGDNPMPAASEASSAPRPVSATEQVATQRTEATTPMPTSEKPSTAKTDNTTPTTTKPEPPKEPEINKNALFSGSRTKNNNKQGGSEGKTYGSGNQGKEGGDPNSNRYDGAPGKGGAGFSLTGRSKIDIPEPKNSTNKEGKIVVRIWVDRAGNVTQTQAPYKGSTIADDGLVRQAKSAAMRAKFSPKDDAPEVQTGTITYVFRNN